MEAGDDFMSKLKSTNSSYCLMRHNRNTVQAQRGSDRSSSGGSNVTYNLSSNSSGMQEKSTESSTMSSSGPVASRNKIVRKT